MIPMKMGAVVGCGDAQHFGGSDRPVGGVDTRHTPNRYAAHPLVDSNPDMKAVRKGTSF